MRARQRHFLDRAAPVEGRITDNFRCWSFSVKCPDWFGNILYVNGSSRLACDVSLYASAGVSTLGLGFGRARGLFGLMAFNAGDMVFGAECKAPRHAQRQGGRCEGKGATPATRVDSDRPFTRGKADTMYRQYPSRGQAAPWLRERSNAVCVLPIISLLSGSAVDTLTFSFCDLVQLWPRALAHPRPWIDAQRTAPGVRSSSGHRSIAHMRLSRFRPGNAA